MTGIKRKLYIFIQIDFSQVTIILEIYLFIYLFINNI